MSSSKFAASISSTSPAMTLSIKCLLLDCISIAVKPLAIAISIALRIISASSTKAPLKPSFPSASTSLSFSHSLNTIKPVPVLGLCSLPSLLVIILQQPRAGGIQ
ncbi:hypothetical protein ACH5RR_009812 [Cinchona calisaya]|uniref:Uncharacterized protein n=1 Tax=Cinchona calisaya TaxID=153742 RepID=A0ABD3AI47_9GENT